MPGIEPRMVAPNPAILNGEEVYPRQVVQFKGQGTMRGELFAMVVVYPVRYSPLRHKLTILTDLEFELNYTGRDLRQGDMTRIASIRDRVPRARMSPLSI
jgi:hypothetical protein